MKKRKSNSEIEKEEEHLKPSTGWDSHSSDAVAAVVLLAIFASCILMLLSAS